MMDNKLLQSRMPAVLALADGSVFVGTSIGADGECSGELVFNTAMMGYQEILTDPSYAEQMVTLTYPHIGNVGMNPQDNQSSKIWAKALVIRELSPVVSNWRAECSLTDSLKSQGVVGIADIDTRRLTRLLRQKGAQNACIMTGSIDPAEALAKAKAYPGLQGKDLAKAVCVADVHEWLEGTQSLDLTSESVKPNFKHHVVVYDYGVKQQILRLLVDMGCRLTVVPATMPVVDVLALKPDGVFLSNGPGDPAACDYAIEHIKVLLEKNIPLFGICLGFQLLVLACGGKTAKMKFGHHGANHPIVDSQTGRVYITSQNHSFMADSDSLPQCLKVSHRSLFDDSLQGFKHVKKPVFALQGHPEASPGPQDLHQLFNVFADMMA